MNRLSIDASGLRALQREAAAGLSAALVSVPVAIGYGLFAFAPLGPQYYSYGVVAGLYSAIVMNTVALLMGARAPLLYGPRNVVAFMINALVLHLLVEQHEALLAQLAPQQIVAIVLLIGLLAGGVQLALGALRAGGAVKYVPHPVIAGFQCAAGLLLIVGQFDAVTGQHEPLRLAELSRQLAGVEVGAVLVAALTLTACLVRPRHWSRLPALAVGGTVGTFAFYLLQALIPDLAGGAILGALPAGLPAPVYPGTLYWALTEPALRELLPSIAIGAISIALISSLDALLGGKALASESRQAFRGNRELTRIGAGNVAGALFGAIPGAIALASSAAGQRASGRARGYCLVHLLLVLGAVVLLPDVLAMIPRAVIGGMLVAVGIGLIDRWTLQQLAGAMREGPRTAAGVWRELSIVGLVAGVALAMNIVLAVAAGIGISVAYFIVRMSRSVIRRSYRCAFVRSRRSRPRSEAEQLVELGERIVVFELEGAIFFGTAEDLANRIVAACVRTPTFVVIDVARVSEIDLSGSRILSRVSDLLVSDGHHLLIAGLREGSPLDRYLDAAGTRTAISSERIFPDIDRALEWAEDGLLRAAAGAATARLGLAATADAVELSQFELFSGLDADELTLLRAELTLTRHPRGTTVFEEGDPGDSLYLVIAGSASAWLRGRRVRLVTFSAGTFIGEVAMIDQSPRTATVIADDDLACLVLPRTGFDRLAGQSPGTAITITANLCRELAHRLRRTNRTLVELSR